MTFQLRPGSITDLDTLFAIEEACFEQQMRFSRDFIARLLSGGISHVATVNGQPVGFLLASIRGGNIRQRLGYIDTIEVLPQYRGQGIAAALLCAAESDIRTQQILTLLLHVDETNATARRLYGRLGYIQFGRTPMFYPNGSAALILQKPLTPADTAKP